MDRREFIASASVGVLSTLSGCLDSVREGLGMNSVDDALILSEEYSNTSPPYVLTESFTVEKGDRIHVDGFGGTVSTMVFDSETGEIVIHGFDGGPTGVVGQEVCRNQNPAYNSEDYPSERSFGYVVPESSEFTLLVVASIPPSNSEVLVDGSRVIQVRIDSGDVGQSGDCVSRRGAEHSYEASNLENEVQKLMEYIQRIDQATFADDRSRSDLRNRALATTRALETKLEIINLPRQQEQEQRQRLDNARRQISWTFAYIGLAEWIEQIPSNLIETVSNDIILPEIREDVEHRDISNQITSSLRDSFGEQVTVVKNDWIPKSDTYLIWDVSLTINGELSPTGIDTTFLIEIPLTIRVEFPYEGVPPAIDEDDIEIKHIEGDPDATTIRID